MNDTRLKSIYEIPEQNKKFIDSIPYLSVKELKNGNTYYKFTGYQAYNKTIGEMTPEGYKSTGLIQFYDPIKATTINLMRLKKL